MANPKNPTAAQTPPPPTPASLRRRLRALMKRAEWSQRDAAAATGYTQVGICLILQGKRHPTPARAFALRLDQLEAEHGL